jgi:hypothetical protein
LTPVSEPEPVLLIPPGKAWRAFRPQNLILRNLKPKPSFSSVMLVFSLIFQYNMAEAARGPPMSIRLSLLSNRSLGSRRERVKKIWPMRCKQWLLGQQAERKKELGRLVMEVLPSLP